MYGSGGVLKHPKHPHSWIRNVNYVAELRRTRVVLCNKIVIKF